NAVVGRGDEITEPPLATDRGQRIEGISQIRGIGGCTFGLPRVGLVCNVSVVSERDRQTRARQDIVPTGRRRERTAPRALIVGSPIPTIQAVLERCRPQSTTEDDPDNDIEVVGGT